MNTELDPTRFHDLLEDATSRGPVPPAPGAEITAGRRMLRRRRIGTGAAALGVLAVLGVTATLLPGGSDAAKDRRDLQAAGQLPADDAGMARACRQGEVTKADREALFDSGSPTVHQVRRDGASTTLALLSADGKAWGECYLSSSPGDEFSASMTAYSTTPDPNVQFTSSETGNCERTAKKTTCDDKLGFSFLTKLPAQVAQVRVTLLDGRVVPTDTDDEGFVNFGATVTTGDKPFTSRPNGLKRLMAYDTIEYLDSSGTVIAAQAGNGTGSGPDGEKIDGLPTLEAFPPAAAQVGAGAVVPGNGAS